MRYNVKRNRVCSFDMQKLLSIREIVQPGKKKKIMWFTNSFMQPFFFFCGKQKYTFWEDFTLLLTIQPRVELQKWHQKHNERTRSVRFMNGFRLTSWSGSQVTLHSSFTKSDRSCSLVEFNMARVVLQLTAQELLQPVFFFFGAQLITMTDH